MHAGRRGAVRLRRRPERADRLTPLDRRADLEGGLDGLERRPQAVRVRHDHDGAVDHHARDGHDPGGGGHDDRALGTCEVDAAVPGEPRRRRDVDVREEQARGHQRRPLEGRCRCHPERQDVQPGRGRWQCLAPGGPRGRERRRHHERREHEGREHEGRRHHARRGPQRGGGPSAAAGWGWPAPGRHEGVCGHVGPAGVAFHRPSLHRPSGARPGAGEELWTVLEPGGPPQGGRPVD